MGAVPNSNNAVIPWNNNHAADVPNSNNSVGPQYTTTNANIFAFVQQSFNEYTINEIDPVTIRADPDGSMTMQIPRIVANPDREQCMSCGKWCKDRKMLERHMSDTRRTCTRCCIKKFRVCKDSASAAWSVRPQCMYGCEECQRCFHREEEQARHNRRYH
jgi:hypothetical protein